MEDQFTISEKIDVHMIQKVILTWRSIYIFKHTVLRGWISSLDDGAE